MLEDIEAGKVGTVIVKDLSKKRRIVNKMKGNAGVPLYRHMAT